MYRFTTLISLLVIFYLPLSVQAQKRLLKPGLYLSEEALVNDQPDLTLEEVELKQGKTTKRNLYSGGMDANSMGLRRSKDFLNSIKIRRIKQLDTLGDASIDVPVESVIAISTETGTYFRIGENLFCKAGLIGPLCHITKEKLKAQRYVQRSYRDQDTKEGKVKYKSTQYLYKLKTGELLPFDKEGVFKLIGDDKKLLAHYLKNTKKEEQLYLYVLKYNERNKS
ncbi:MAG: hypothetical protein AAF990_09570 [Bacteroidota bacterium]